MGFNQDGNAQNITRRKSTRLRNYDYSQTGLYFLTLCTKNREPLFGQISEGQMYLNKFGKIASEEWQRTAIMRPTIQLHDFTIMPNHAHMIIEIVAAHGMRIVDTCTPIHENNPMLAHEITRRVQRAAAMGDKPTVAAHCMRLVDTGIPAMKTIKCPLKRLQSACNARLRWGYLFRR